MHSDDRALTKKKKNDQNENGKIVSFSEERETVVTGDL
jgi:hypothetical protein